MLKRLIPVMSLLAAVAILLMLNFTTPADGPLGVLIFFLACYVLMLGIALLLVRIFMKILGRPMGHKGYLYSAIIAFGPIMLLLAQSLGSMSPFTVALMLIFVFLACFLVSKRG